MKLVSIILGVSVVILMILSSCKKDEETPNKVVLAQTDYLVFGVYGGFTSNAENAHEIYRLENNRLLEDLIDGGPKGPNFYVGDYVVLSQQKFNYTSDLLTNFPNDLLAEPSGDVGPRDSVVMADAPNIYIEYNYNGIHKYWIFNQNYIIPTNYQAFIDKIYEKVSYLK